MLKPKHSIASLKIEGDSNRKKAGRYFTGRTIQRQELKNIIESKSSDSYKVLHYYGIGGIGKTRLQKEMMEEAGTDLTTSRNYMDHFWSRAIILGPCACTME